MLSECMCVTVCVLRLPPCSGLLISFSRAPSLLSHCPRFHACTFCACLGCSSNCRRRSLAAAAPRLLDVPRRRDAPTLFGQVAHLSRPLLGVIARSSTVRRRDVLRAPSPCACCGCSPCCCSPLLEEAPWVRLGRVLALAVDAVQVASAGREDGRVRLVHVCR